MWCRSVPPAKSKSTISNTTRTRRKTFSELAALVDASPSSLIAEAIIEIMAGSDPRSPVAASLVEHDSATRFRRSDHVALLLEIAHAIRTDSRLPPTVVNFHADYLADIAFRLAATPRTSPFQIANKRDAEITQEMVGYYARQLFGTNCSQWRRTVSATACKRRTSNGIAEAIAKSHIHPLSALREFIHIYEPKAKENSVRHAVDRWVQSMNPR